MRRQKRHPGLVIFRGVSGANEGHTLFVFMVGETPTAGVNKVQFQLARSYSRLIREAQQDVSIMAPTFSGSFESLTEMIQLDQSGSKVKHHYVVRSGTATNLAAARKFQKTVEDVRGANENSSDQIKYSCITLNELGIKLSELAMLIEEETSFARGFASAKCPGLNGDPSQDVQVFRFPRDISHLGMFHETVAAEAQTNKALQLGAVAALSFTCFQIMVAVRALERLLVSLNSLPLAGAFARLDICGAANRFGCAGFGYGISISQCERRRFFMI